MNNDPSDFRNTLSSLSKNYKLVFLSNIQNSSDLPAKSPLLGKVMSMLNQMLKKSRGHPKVDEV